MRLNLMFLLVVLLTILRIYLNNKCGIILNEKSININKITANKNRNDIWKHVSVSSVKNTLESTRSFKNINRIHICDIDNNNTWKFGSATFECTIVSPQNVVNNGDPLSNYININEDTSFSYEIPDNLHDRFCEEKSKTYYYWPQQTQEHNGEIKDDIIQYVFLYKIEDINLRYIEKKKNLPIVIYNDANKPNSDENIKKIINMFKSDQEQIQKTDEIRKKFMTIQPKINEKLKILKDTVAELNDEINPKEDIL